MYLLFNKTLVLVIYGSSVGVTFFKKLLISICAIVIAKFYFFS